ncbi:MAG: peptide deformylase [Armatimonadota bacterium]|nr:peptide deformylase [Armatimonadota bacterium]MCX7778108.1 peptide deformylase [Armatimonadota bacterium]MDW8026169.1 peptide deformylase [Armatimonadota bacterium]
MPKGSSKCFDRDGVIKPTSKARSKARPIKLLGDPILRAPAKPVEKLTKSIGELIDQMFASMEAANGVGLAANQIGVPKRICVARHAGQTYVLINPEVMWESDETEEGVEGCLSIPNVQAVVLRPIRLRVMAYDRDGNRFEIDAEGMLARILQHELDHLDGKLIIDRAVEGSLHWVLTQVDDEGNERVVTIPTTPEEVERVFTEAVSSKMPGHDG